MTKDSSLRLPRILTKDHPVRAEAFNRWFWIILALKLLVGLFFGSHYIRDLFAPFVEYYVQHPFANPWDAFNELGRLKAFPYHLGMLSALAPFRMVLLWLPDPGWQTATFVDFLAIRLPLLMADMLIYTMLVLWFRMHVKRIFWLYWCSPLVSYILYFHGQLDILPVAAVLMSLYLLRRRRLWAAAICFGLGLGMKTTALILFPFLAVYVYRKYGFSKALRFVALGISVVVALIAPFTGSPGYQAMVLGSEEQFWLFEVSYLMPIVQTPVYFSVGALAILFTRFATYSKINFDLLMMYVGLVMIIVVSLVPPMPGWFIWFYPVLIYGTLISTKRQVLHIVVLNGAFLLWFLLFAPSADLFDAARLLFPSAAEANSPAVSLPSFGVLKHLPGMVLTVQMATLFYCFFWLYKEGVRSNQIYLPRKSPLVVGISGNSGAGKDTLCTMIQQVIGRDMIIQIDGDDYHKWERGHPGYNSYTHLHVMSNDLHKQRDDILMLAANLPIRKARYDHDTGQFTEMEEVSPKKLILVNGLHSFFLKDIQQMMKLKIFLDPEPDLCTAWKVLRDTSDRGYSEKQVKDQIEARREDADTFIKPMAKSADLVFSYGFLPRVDKDRYMKRQNPDDLKLITTVSNSYDLSRIVLFLETYEGVDVAFEYLNDQAQVRLSVSGKISSDLIGQIAAAVIPSMEELAEMGSDWQDGLMGLQQLITIYVISQTLQQSEREFSWQHEQSLSSLP